MRKVIFMGLLLLVGLSSSAMAETKYGYGSHKYQSGQACFEAVRGAAKSGYYPHGSCDCSYTGRWECQVESRKRTASDNPPALGANGGVGSTKEAACNMAKYDKFLFPNARHVGGCACEESVDIRGRKTGDWFCFVAMERE